MSSTTAATSQCDTMITSHSKYYDFLEYFFGLVMRRKHHGVLWFWQHERTVIMYCCVIRSNKPSNWRSGRSGTVFYLLSWSPSHLKFFRQVTWPFSIYTPNALEAKSLGRSRVTLVADLERYWVPLTSLSMFCIFKFIYLTLYRMVYNTSTEGSQRSLHW